METSKGSFTWIRLADNNHPTVYDVDDVNGKTALHWAVCFRASKVSAFLVQSGADLAAEDKYGVVPQHCLLFDSVTTNFYSHRPILFDQARSSDDNSKYELLEEPALQALHRRLHDCETFQSILARASGFDLNEIDMLGETILFKAIRSDDVDLVYKLVQSGAHVVQKNRHGTTSIALACGMGNLKVVRCLLKHGADPTVGHAYRDDSNAIAYALRFNRHEVLKYLLKTHSLTIQYPLLAELKHKLLLSVAVFADVKTLEILKTVKWVNEDIEDLINCRSYFHYTVRQAIEKRRAGERFPALEVHPDEDPEQIYHFFLSFLQKIIDDHYGFEGDEANSIHGRHTRRMVLIPRKDTEYYWDIVEKDIHMDRDISEVESDDEAWEDAPEQPIGQQATL